MRAADCEQAMSDFERGARGIDLWPKPKKPRQISGVTKLRSKRGRIQLRPFN